MVDFSASYYTIDSVQARGSQLEVTFQNSDRVSVDIADLTPSRAKEVRWDSAHLSRDRFSIVAPASPTSLEIPWDRIRRLTDPSFREHMAKQADAQARATGGVIRKLREGKGLSQEQVSEAAGVEQGHLSKIESGRVVPTLSTVGRILDTLGHTFQDLITRDPENARLEPATTSVVHHKPAVARAPGRPVAAFRQFAGRLNRLADSVPGASSFEKLLQDFSALLPDAIEAVVKQQRRSQLDVLRDLTWALKHNVRHYREFMEEQADAARRGVTEIWVANLNLFDLDPTFYKRTVRPNLIDGVNYCYFVSDVAQFQKLSKMVTRDPGKKYLEQLACISLSGREVRWPFAIDFALWNPAAKDPMGYFAFRVPRDPADPAGFLPLPTERVQSVRELLLAIKKGVLTGKGHKMDVPVTASLAKQAWLN